MRREHESNEAEQMCAGSITPNQFTGSDTERIHAAVEAARGVTDQVVIPSWNANGTGVWSIDRAILLPSRMTVVLDNCTMKLSDICRDNMFRSDNVGIGITNPQWNHDISIIGVGNVELHGADNPRATGDGVKRLSLTPDEDRKAQGYHISYGSDAGKEGAKQISDWRNIMILMAYVKGINLRNIKIHCPHGWSISFERCWNADISGIRFDNPGTRIIGGKHRRMLNQDGINLRHGCKNFRIDDISGYIEEDCIALSSLDSGDESFHGHGSVDSVMITPTKWYGPEDDTEQVFISNVLTGITGVAIWASDRARIHNVHMNGIIGQFPRGLEHVSNRTVGIATAGYGELSEPGAVRDIFAMNISGAGKRLIYIDAPVENCYFVNGILRNGGEVIEYSDRVKGKTRNVVLQNVVNCPGSAARFNRDWVFSEDSRGNAHCHCEVRGDADSSLGRGMDPEAEANGEQDGPADAQ